MNLRRLGSVDDFAGEIDADGRVTPSICCVKSIKFSVSFPSRAGVLCRRGVGDGEREIDSERRLREVCGVFAPSLRPGVRRKSPRLVGDCPSFAKRVISGISEKVLKQVSSTFVVSWKAERASRAAWNCDGVRAGSGSARSDDLPRLLGRGVVPSRRDRSGVFLGVLRIVGGGMRSASALLLRRSSLIPFRSCPFSCCGTGSGVAAFLGVKLIFVVVTCAVGIFSLSSMKSVKSIISSLLGLSIFAFKVLVLLGVWRVDAVREAANCLLGLRLLAAFVSTSVMKGELGGPSRSNMLGSTLPLSCTDGDSMFDAV